MVVYVLLNKVSFVHDLQHTEISLWGPNIALIVAAVMFFCPRVTPLAILVPGVSEIVLRGAMPFGISVIGSMLRVGRTYSVTRIVLRGLQRNYADPTIGWFAILSRVSSVAA